jgi:hypothetical protein
MQRDLDVHGAMRRRVRAALCGALIAWTIGPPGGAHIAAAQTNAAGAVQLRTLSTRPDLVSGGDVLVQLSAPAGTTPESIAVLLNGRDVTAAFRASSAANVRVALLRELRVGNNELVATSRGREPAAKLTLVNHPITGPVISGPHQTPFVCETEAFGLEAVAGADCSANTRVDYFYRSTAAAGRPAAAGATSAQALAAPDAAPPAAAPGGGRGGASAPNPFKPFDPRAPRPADLGMTTTSDGRTVPYIVRREMGTVNRAVYVIAFLHEPGQPLPDPWTSTSAWNGRLIYSFGGGCRAGYHQGRTAGGLTTGRGYLEESQLGDYALAKGFAVAAASLNVFGTTCADLISAETVMMVKEHFIESFGVPRYTIGSGRSGGSMQQHLIANNYPGLLDGIIPTASFADTLTFVTPLFDCELLTHALATSTLTWTDQQKAAVAGQATFAYCAGNGARYPNLRPANCDPDVVPAALVYNPSTNRQGARCTYQDNMVNVFGRDPRTGFARRPFDNVGVQYGLRALHDGQITFDQFLDLNRRIGGHDIDGAIVAARTAADPEALRIAYETGRLNDARRGLSAVPIIDVRPYTDGDDDVHDIVASHITRARLVAANGHADNQVFRTYAPGTAIQIAQREVLDAMDRWLSNMAADTAPARTALEKVVRNKPNGLTDACYTASGEAITDPARCSRLFPVAANPRIVAGSPLAHDRLKCELKPVDRADYPSSITAAQLASVRTVFPDGVCDYTRPGVRQQQAPQTWRSYPATADRASLVRSRR